jgi:aminotransferase EvaB
MGIPVWDYRREYEAERADILDAVDKVFRSGRLILGSSVAESRWAS